MRRRTIQRRILAFTAGLALGVTTLLAAACGDDPTATPTTTPSATTTTTTTPATASASPSGTPADAWTPVPADQLTTSATGLMYKDEVVGTGERPKAGECIAVHYTGRLDDGTIFDSSAGGSPFTFVIGATPRQVIAGWDEGLASMQVGGKRILVIPSDLGYGPDGYPPIIPGNATLNFDVELRSIRGRAACR